MLGREGMDDHGRSTRTEAPSFENACGSAVEKLIAKIAWRRIRHFDDFAEGSQSVYATLASGVQPFTNGWTKRLINLCFYCY
jgi:hypothetical protein